MKPIVRTNTLPKLIFLLGEHQHMQMLGVVVRLIIMKVIKMMIIGKNKNSFHNTQNNRLLNFLLVRNGVHKKTHQPLIFPNENEKIIQLLNNKTNFMKKNLWKNKNQSNLQISLKQLKPDFKKNMKNVRFGNRVSQRNVEDYLVGTAVFAS